MELVIAGLGRMGGNMARRLQRAGHRVIAYNRTFEKTEELMRDEGLEVVIARSFNHAGPGQDDRFVFPSMARQLVRMRRGEADPVLRVGNLEVYRDGEAYPLVFDAVIPQRFQSYNGKLFIGCATWSNYYCVDGMVDEVRIATASRSAPKGKRGDWTPSTVSPDGR